MIKCLDTYVLMEITEGRQKKYLETNFVILDLVLAEFYSVLLRDHGKQTAEYWFRILSPYSISVNMKILKNAVIFKYENRKQRISFFDAVGYIFSLENNYVFVTGDKEFKNKKKVELIN